MSHSRPEPSPPAGSNKSPADEIPRDPGSDDARPRLRSLILALLLAVTWYAILIATVTTTANPDVVNRVQIQSSVLVVSGTVDGSGNVNVERVFLGVLPDKALQVILPADVPPGRYILPLSRLAGRFEITPSRSTTDLRRVYPVTDDVVNQLQRLLDE